MLHDSKDMPKFQIITDQKSIEKYGGSRMYFAPPIEYDKVMKLIPYGKVITVGKIREYFAELNGADFTEPITAGIFVSIAAWASYQRSEDETPYWRTLKANGELNAKYPGGVEAQKEKVQGRVVIQMIVDKNGNVTRPKIIEGVNPSLDAEAIRVTTNMPKWKPGTQRGKVVDVKYTFPIVFRLQ